MSAVKTPDERLRSVQLLTVNQVCSLIGITRRTLEIMRREGAFPSAIYPRGMKRPRWRLRDVEKWIDKAK